MKRSVLPVVAKILIIIVSLFAILILGGTVYYSVVTADVSIDENKLINLDYGVTFYDAKDKVICDEQNNHSVTSIDKIPLYVQNAFISIEDKRFYQHHGVDVKGLLRATINNVKTFSLKEGASTITQQLIKNTHLSNKKTLKRKLSEIKLAKKLEKTHTKKDILEKYLNTIYFGEGCYGITSASKLYFDKTPTELNINEGAILAGIIKAPSNYSPYTNYEKCKQRKNLVLTQMYEQKYITQEEYNNYSSQEIEVNGSKTDRNYGYIYFTKKELSSYLDDNAYKNKKIRVSTYLDKEIQNKVDEVYENSELDENKTIIVMDNQNNVVAYRSNCGEIYRQMGSTIKPLLVYAPAVEENVVSSITPILDEKVNYDGYTPSNYNDKYYGYVSVKDSLAKSLNSCAVKILNYTGIEKSKQYINQTDINLTNKDNSLCIALGCTEHGATLSQLTSAYGVFSQKGYYSSPQSVKGIWTESGNALSYNERFKKKIFSEECSVIITDALRETVLNGTAKKLSFLDFPVYSKTGTVGVASGNTDAYNVSFNEDYTIGVWCGNKKDKLLSNEITGGTYPTKMAYELWNMIGGKKEDILLKSDKISNVELDKIDYETNHALVLADINSPKRFVISGLFKNDNCPKEQSTRFSCPTIKNAKLLVNNKQINITLCLTQCIEAKIYREENGVKELIIDSKELKNKEKFIDKKIKSNATYQYTVIPYFQNEISIFYGKEYNLGTVKISKDVDDDWWINDE